MMNNKTLTTAEQFIAAIFLISILFPTAYMGYVVVPPRVGYPATPDDPPIFTVQPSSYEYRMGEPIALTLTLSIPYHAVEYYWEICTFAPGSVRVIYVKRDGVGVTASHNTVANFPTGTHELQQMFIVQLWSNSSVSISFSLGMAKNGAARLYDTSLSGEHSRLVRNPITGEYREFIVPEFATPVYQFDQPGLYAIKL
jgi:hypothetical protein